MPDYDERAELAPRDIVARRSTMRSSATASIMSTSTSATATRVREEHFPNIYEKLLGLGIDITQEPIPVVPPSITPAAACWWISDGGPTRRASMPPAR
jgi:L-aspartate oxidase